MQNSSSLSPILDFGRQHATAESPFTARSFEIAAQRSILLRPRGKHYQFQGHCRWDPVQASRSPPLLKAGKLSMRTRICT